MMYNNKLAVALKSADGKVLREFGENVYVPFGSEYSVLIKNLHTSARVLVTVHIDGQDVGNGNHFVITPKSSLDLERFVKTQSTGNRFKFIERTSEVEQHRGIDVEDGLVRVEYQFEIPNNVFQHWNQINNRSFLSGNNSRTFYANSLDVSCSTNSEIGKISVPQNETGVTAPGSISNQQFNSVMAFPVEATTHSIILKILGETADNKDIREPITVKTKIECVSCGKKKKAKSKFCTECGTSLQIVA